MIQQVPIYELCMARAPEQRLTQCSCTILRRNESNNVDSQAKKLHVHSIHCALIQEVLNAFQRGWNVRNDESNDKCWQLDELHTFLWA